MQIENFLESRQIFNYHCPDHTSKVFVEQQLFSTCITHNGLRKHTLYPGKKVKICYIVLFSIFKVTYQKNGLLSECRVYVDLPLSPLQLFSIIPFVIKLS